MSPIGIRAAYPSPAATRSLSRKQRGKLRGRIVVISTSNPFYSLKGVRPGSRLTRKVARRLKARNPIKIGRNRWYVISNGSTRWVLKVQHGKIGEIGIANSNLTRTRAASRRLLTNLP